MVNFQATRTYIFSTEENIQIIPPQKKILYFKNVKKYTDPQKSRF